MIETSTDMAFDASGSATNGDGARSPSRPHNAWARRLEAVWREALPYRIDRALASRISPCETLVVSGFWRSGTTWLQQSLAQLLRAKTVFEPLHYTVPAAREIHAACGLSGKAKPFRELYLPYCGGTVPDGHPLYRFLDRALRSDMRGRAIRVLRTGFADPFRRRIVLKFVRSHLFLRAAQNTFAMPTIHIYRDPRAVIASIKSTSWRWLFDHLSLQEQLIEPSDGRASFFRRWQDHIADYDRRDPLTRATAYWALTERFVQDSYADHPPTMVWMSYEDLCRRKEVVLLDALRQLNLRPARYARCPAMKHDSFTTSDPRRGASLEERLLGWRNALSTSEVAMIESTAQLFGLEHRLTDESGTET